MTRPNILIIYPDQMRADALGCAGNPCVETPHIDRLAAQGVRFSHAYTAFPLCCPFRASLLTGKYPHANGMRANHYPISLDQAFLAQILQDAGYKTAYFGKWHLDGGVKFGYVPPGPRRLGFEHFVGYNRGHQYFGGVYYRDSEQPYTSERYEPEVQTDHLIGFLNERARDPEAPPFFAEICYGPPHPPLVAPERYLTRYSPDEVPIRPSVPDTAQAQARARTFTAKYYGLVASVDDNVGRVMACLDELNLADDTCVIFVSDHGEMAGEHGRYGKKTFYEASMHVPMIVRYPRGFVGGRVVRSLVDPSVDTMPTLLALCGLDVPDDVQGQSYLPLLDQSAEATRDAVFYEICKELEGPERFPVPERGIRTERWLYVETEAGPNVLFDLQEDPLELNNLVGSPAHRAIISELHGRVTSHMAATGDDWSLEAVFPPPGFVTHEAGRDAWQQLHDRAIVEP